MLPCVRRGAIAGALLGALLLGACATPAGAPVTDPAPAAAHESLAPAEPTSTLSTMTVAELPAEAVDTLELIRQGGPFPFDQDGATFQNRERLLPPAPQGFYEEYTVITPGEDDRGARRIVAADDGGRFYTDDHYDSFTEVVSG
jgi:ribonuclease T1